MSYPDPIGETRAFQRERTYRERERRRLEALSNEPVSDIESPHKGEQLPVCGIHGTLMSATQFGVVCAECIRDAMHVPKPAGPVTSTPAERIAVARAAQNEKIDSARLTCKTCGERIPDPGILINGVGECCRAPAPDVRDAATRIAMQALGTDLAGLLDCAGPSESTDLAETGPALAATLEALGDDGPYVDERTPHGIRTIDGAGQGRRPIHPDPPELPTAGPGERMVIRLDAEQAGHVMRAIEAMRNEHDGVFDSETQLLGMVCRDWFYGKGRPQPPVRPEPDF
jgi:hypothetical protein